MVAVGQAPKSRPFLVPASLAEDTTDGLAPPDHVVIIVRPLARRPVERSTLENEPIGHLTRRAASPFCCSVSVIPYSRITAYHIVAGVLHCALQQSWAADGRDGSKSVIRWCWLNVPFTRERTWPVIYGGPTMATADSHYVQGARRKSRATLADPEMPRPDHPALGRSLFETVQSHFRENLARGGIDIRHGAPRRFRAWPQN